MSIVIIVIKMIMVVKRRRAYAAITVGGAVLFILHYNVINKLQIDFHPPPPGQRVPLTARPAALAYDVAPRCALLYYNTGPNGSCTYQLSGIRLRTG